MYKINQNNGGMTSELENFINGRIKQFLPEKVETCTTCNFGKLELTACESVSITDLRQSAEDKIRKYVLEKGRCEDSWHMHDYCKEGINNIFYRMSEMYSPSRDYERALQMKPDRSNKYIPPSFVILSGQFAAAIMTKLELNFYIQLVGGLYVLAAILYTFYLTLTLPWDEELPCKKSIYNGVLQKAIAKFGV